MNRTLWGSSVPYTLQWLLRVKENQRRSWVLIHSRHRNSKNVSTESKDLKHSWALETGSVSWVGKNI